MAAPPALRSEERGLAARAICRVETCPPCGNTGDGGVDVTGGVVGVAVCVRGTGSVDMIMKDSVCTAPNGAPLARMLPTRQALVARGSEPDHDEAKCVSGFLQ